ncbi:magnesium transporter CorA family protein [Pseudolactococcus insecticola]|uniref:Dihydroorotate dehydrogenase n=1 Tax=Pseudolactococcus insecticola TaxID=2709158 RepID=A0A6A0B8N3_9LACT|nr:magnesium transporter CorA family protein [Lactococcus insecticola]GFH41196.1 dihydroorotate dehydrogenase [Lactococcus insecticola]
MIKKYELANKQLAESKDYADFTYIINPTRTEIGEVATRYQFPFDYIAGILDDDENARFETDDNGNILLLLQYPLAENGSIEVFPFSLIVNAKENAVILSLNHECNLDNLFARTFETARYQHEIIYQVMNVMARSFNQYLSQYKKRMRSIEEDLKYSQENAQIMEIIRSQKSLIYFEAALDDNIAVYQKFMTYLRDQDENGFSDKIFDVYIESTQALTTTEIQLKLLENLSDLFSNIVSNNLNIIMKIMTSATFVMTIPAIIAGLYGMNVKLPFQSWPHAFWFILAITLLISTVVFRVMLRKRMF